MLLMDAVVDSSQRCQQVRESQIYSLCTVFYKLGFILDLVSTLYFVLNEGFSRVEYYVYYSIHLIAFIGMGFGLLFINDEEIDASCPDFTWVRVGCLWSRLTFFAVSLTLMQANLYLGLRWTHCGANLIWVALWFLQPVPRPSNTMAIGLVHAVIAGASALALLAMEAAGRGKTFIDIWQTLVKISMVGLAISWAYSALQYWKIEGQGHLFVSVYFKYGLVELVSPLLYLIFVNVEQGDPREYFMDPDHDLML